MKNQGKVFILMEEDDPDYRKLMMKAFQPSRLQGKLGFYTAGASSYVTKPQRFDDLVDIIALLGKYWLEVGELPL